MSTPFHRSPRWWTAVALCLLALALPMTAASAQEQSWRLQGLNGGGLTEADVASGTTIMVVWSSWSPRCRDIIDQVGRIAHEWGGRARIVTVDFQEDPQDVRSFLGGKSMPAPIYLDSDGTFSKRHHVSTLPGLVVYKNGTVTYQGKLPENPGEVLRDAAR